MRSRNLAIGAEEDADINMTPMLDIVFIMLIFFIVSTSFVREAGVDINRPAANSGEAKEGTAVMLAITEEGDIWLDRRLVDMRMIRPVMERIKTEQPDPSVVIQADEKARTGILVKVMDQLRLSGVTNISVATKPGGGQ